MIVDFDGEYATGEMIGEPAAYAHTCDIVDGLIAKSVPLLEPANKMPLASVSDVEKLPLPIKVEIVAPVEALSL